MEKRLYRSNSDVMFTGLCAGIAEYFNIDPSIVRLITVALCFGGGSGLLAYIIGALIVPKRPY